MHSLLAALDNEWVVHSVDTSLPQITAFSDASLPAWCTKIPQPTQPEVEEVHWGPFPPELAQEGIYEKEMYALYLLIQQLTARPQGCEAHLNLGCDNKGVIGAWNKGFTTNIMALDLLLRSHLCLAVAGSKASVFYVNTLENSADSHTRVTDTSIEGYTEPEALPPVNSKDYCRTALRRHPVMPVPKKRKTT